jgi:archaellum biogenesis protein FlaJ (TadC family)
MSFREKSAWVTLIALVLLAVAFLIAVLSPWILSPTPGGREIDILFISIVAFVTVEVVAYVVLRWQSPRDARTPKDERERLIEIRSRAIAYYAFTAVVFVGTFVALHVVGANQFDMGWLVLCSFVASQIVNYGLRIFYYRRGF